VNMVISAVVDNIVKLNNIITTDARSRIATSLFSAACTVAVVKLMSIGRSCVIT